MTDIELSLVVGGQSQAQLRALAQQYCPRTFAQQGNRPITRAAAERCLGEANMPQYLPMLDRYFPRR
jgi:hypothetical protein